MATQHASYKRKRRITNFFVYLILISICLVWVLPFVYLVLQSFRLENGATLNYIIPKKFTLQNYILLFTDKRPAYNFVRWYFNTLIISIATALIQTVMVLMVSYVFSRLRFKFRQTYMKLILILGMFPGFMSMIAIYQILKIAQLHTNIFTLIIVYCASSAMNYYISKGFFDTIPYSLDEAAKIDGATQNKIFIKIILPLAKPIIVYALLVAFIAPWGDYMFASYLANGAPDMFNVAVGLKNFLHFEMINEAFTRFCAGAVFTSIPIVILFFVLQRFYVEGVTGGSVKG